MNIGVGNMASANELLGFLHGFYGLGATVAPLVATAMVTADLPWYSFYYIMVNLPLLFSDTSTDHPTRSLSQQANS